MSTTAARLNFTQLTPGQTYAFTSADAWNSYFQNVTITLVNANIPLATTSEAGGVKISVYPFFFFYDPLNEFAYYTVNDTGGVNRLVPSKESFIALYNAFKNLAVNIQAMQQAFVNAGNSSYTG